MAKKVSDMTEAEKALDKKAFSTLDAMINRLFNFPVQNLLSWIPIVTDWIFKNPMGAPEKSSFRKAEKVVGAFQRLVYTMLPNTDEVFELLSKPVMKQVYELRNTGKNKRQRDIAYYVFDEFKRIIEYKLWEIARAPRQDKPNPVKPKKAATHKAAKPKKIENPKQLAIDFNKKPSK